MPLPNAEDLAGLKLSMMKDLEKTLKIGYEHQYRNILSKIVSKKKRFIKKRLPVDASENICRYNSLAAGLTGYITNLFDVFGESAALNAKKTFEENGCKWGKKLRRKLNLQESITDINSIIGSLYLNVPDMDFIEVSGNDLVWHLLKQGHSNANESFTMFCPRYYDIKAAWLSSFIKYFTLQYTCIFEKKSEDDSKIITRIELKEDMG